MAIYFEEAGDKNAPTIVFIHGGGMSGWMWKKQREAFGDYHLLIPDLPDHGKSLNEGSITIEDAADRTAELIRARAKGGRAHVVGHSLGGKIIVQMLAEHPETVDRAIVASALFRPMPLLNITMNMPTYRLSVWMLKSKTMLELQARQFNFPDDFYKENFKKEASATTVEMLGRIYSQLNGHLSLPEGLGRAEAPTLVIAGEKEPKAMRLSVADVAHALPNAKACLVRGGRHTFPWEQADVFTAAVRAWLEGGEINNQAIFEL